jgi:hypothetical protein
MSGNYIMVFRRKRERLVPHVNATEIGIPAITYIPTYNNQNTTGVILSIYYVLILQQVSLLS